MHQVLQPPDWPRPPGYANGIAARGVQVFIAGQVGLDASRKFLDGSLASQVKRTLENIVRVLAEAGGRPEHIVRLTWYITSREEYLGESAEIGQAYRTIMGRHFPAMSVVQVAALVEPRAKVEIEATAVVPET